MIWILPYYLFLKTASIYVEEYSLVHGISADDALIAATAIENNQILVSGNSKHYKPINDITFKKFVTI